MALEWVPGVAVAFVGSALAYWRSSSVATAVLDKKVDLKLANIDAILDAKVSGIEALLDSKIQTLKEDNASVVSKLERASEQMSRAASDFQAAQASQAVINGFTTKVLDSLASKFESNEKQISEHSTTLSLMREYLLKRDKV